MSFPYRSILRILAWSLVSAATAPASAQTVCITPNCASGGTPAACLNRAAPRTPTVLMGVGGIYLVFDPPDPKIEPGGCIVWNAATQTHSSSGSACTADLFCGLPPSVPCEWDSANVSSASATPTSTCFYDPALFPAATADDFHCRIHASMFGTLQVTTPIQLSVDKDVATNSVKLTFGGGGVAGDISYKVARQTGGDPRFPAGSTVTVDPDGGVLGTIFTDAGDLASPTTRYYLVRNKQTNEP